MQILICHLLVLFFCACASAQYRYCRVYFKDKGNTNVFASKYFTERAIEKRRRLNIPWQKSDYPVCKTYINKVKQLAQKQGYKSRWLNYISVWASLNNLKAIAALPFVAKIDTAYHYVNQHIASINQEQKNLEINYLINPKKLAKYQMKRLGKKTFDKFHLNGNNILIGVLDAGFSGLNKLLFFKKIIADGRLISTYDFVRKKKDVFRASIHGTDVVGCIAGSSKGVATGLAKSAGFLLARTENALSERMVEVDRWIAGIEWMEQQGADIVNSSIGYTFALYPQNYLNGKTPISKAANIAAQKGVLVINAAGNEYNNTWQMLIAPADAKGVLAVGGINPYLDYQINFSSVGPTADGRLKPNVCAPGYVAVPTKNGLKTVQGTSFSAPLITGFAACVLQYYKKKINSLKLLEIIENAGHLYPYYDYAHGYGVPMAKYAIYKHKNNPKNTFQTYWRGDTLWFVPNPNYNYSTNGYHLLFYHVSKPDGYLLNYNLIKIYGTEPVNFYISSQLPKKNLTKNVLLNREKFGYDVFLKKPPKGSIFRIHFEGKTKTIQF